MLKTMPRLGLGNVARVAAYRASLKNPLSSIRRLADNPPAAPKGPFFDMARKAADKALEPIAPPPLFGFHPLEPRVEAPGWFVNPLTQAIFQDVEKPFYKIADFNEEVGDIKLIWELSRFNWVIDLAARAVSDTQNQESYIARLESWLGDWTSQNPPFQGPNWKCGQESSLRVLHLLMASVLLGVDKAPQAGLKTLIVQHLQRIEPTQSYAKAQDNNHGTSEATALFIGGAWLQSLGDKRGRKWASQGRSLLENRTRYLIMDDGCFSQYSVNYHRMMLDTLSYAKWWQTRLKAPSFSQAFKRKACLAADWLYRMADTETGDVPNMGANDGAHILNVASANYRDYRPSVAIAFAVFKNERAYPNVESVERQLGAFNLSPSSPLKSVEIKSDGKSGGFAALNDGNFRAYFRYPKFRFRPPQSDLLHIDLWHKGRNILRDGGTYSYNAGDEALSYFGGTASHNTIQFEGRDQMPRLGRFLFGAWAKTINWASSNTYIQAGYKDHKGAIHTRRLELDNNGCNVIDQISSRSDRATLRWRFDPNVFGNLPSLNASSSKTLSIAADGFTVDIQCEHPFTARWIEGWGSRHYYHKTALPVLEIVLERVTSAEIVTIIREAA